MIVSLPPTLAANLPRPILSPLYAAGNAFSRCHAVKRVPADPNLQMVFEADEFATFARYVAVNMLLLCVVLVCCGRCRMVCPLHRHTLHLRCVCIHSIFYECMFRGEDDYLVQTEGRVAKTLLRPQWCLRFNVSC